MNRAGKTAVRAARAMRTDPSSTRLTQDFENVAAELRHLVEKEHAVVREADLAWARMLAAADERDVRDRVMRRAERPLGQQPRAGRQESGDRVDRRRLERLLERQRRQDRRDSPRHHRLARAGRADHQHVVAARGGDLERAARQRLAVDVREVAVERRVAAAEGGGMAAVTARNAIGSFRRRDGFGERSHGIELEPVDDRGFAAVGDAAGAARDSRWRRAAAAIGSTPRAG